MRHVRGDHFGSAFFGIAKTDQGLVTFALLFLIAILSYGFAACDNTRASQAGLDEQTLRTIRRAQIAGLAVMPLLLAIV